MRQREKNINPLDREFIRLLTDFGFKRVFGTRQHSEILRRFLNALFEGEMYIESVEFRDKELLPEYQLGKKVMYDIYCTTKTGKHFILEMQQEESENFSDRIVFYAAKAFVNQGVKGEEYRIDPVYCVVLTDFNLSWMSKTLLKDIVLMDRQTNEVYSENPRLIFLSLKKVPKEWDECKTELLKLLYLIKNMENLTRESKPYLSGEYNDIFKASATESLSNEEAVAYSQSYYKELENRSALRFATRKGREEGRQEGRQEGIEIGREQGLGQGIEIGREQGLGQGIEIGREQAIAEKVEEARRLGLSEELISKLFGV